MSFILDQLKKSGKQRQLELAMRGQKEAPEEADVAPVMLKSEERTSAPRGHKWQIAAVAVLLVIVALYGTALLFKGSLPGSQSVVPDEKRLVQKSSPLPETLSSDTPVQFRKAQADQARASGAEGREAEQKQTAAAKAAQQATVREKDRNASVQAGADSSAEKGEPQQPAARIEQSMVAKSSDTPVVSAVMEFKQLPQAVRKSLPEIRITSHLYKKDSPLVSINGRIMSEGFNMDDGLFLEEITPEGVILIYGKHRFLVRAK